VATPERQPAMEARAASDLLPKQLPNGTTADDGIGYSGVAAEERGRGVISEKAEHTEVQSGRKDEQQCHKIEKPHGAPQSDPARDN